MKLKSILPLSLSILLFGATLTSCNNEEQPKTSKSAPAKVDPLKQRQSVSGNTENSAESASQSSSNAQITFAKYEHDFGNILQDSDNKFTFTFTNTGTEPLIIENAKGSCGCTVPEYTKDPIAPGETGKLDIVYKPGKQKNQQTKTITVTANTSPKTTTLRIKANVLEFAS
jgi:hypothetical protein